MLAFASSYQNTRLSVISSTFGVKTLMSSLRKRNLAASPWNLLPQLFIHASRTWKAPNRNKSWTCIFTWTSENVKRIKKKVMFLMQHKREGTDSVAACLWLTTFYITWHEAHDYQEASLNCILTWNTAAFFNVLTTNRLVSQQIQMQMIKSLMSPCDKRQSQILFTGPASPRVKTKALFFSEWCDGKCWVWVMAKSIY